MLLRLFSALPLQWSEEICGLVFPGVVYLGVAVFDVGCGFSGAKKDSRRTPFTFLAGVLVFSALVVS